MRYIIPENLIEALNAINNQTGIFAVPCSGSNYVYFDLPDSQAHADFVSANNLQPDFTHIVEQDQVFCKQLHRKLLAAFKAGPTLNQNTYRQLSDIFWYAKDAADNGNPTNLKIELQAIPDEETLGLTGWDVLRASLIAEIDSYLNK